MIWALVLIATALLVLVVTLPPFVGMKPRLVIMQVFSHACHQMPARSPHIDGVQLAVCHRCYGIYWGLPLAVLGFLALRRWDPFIDRHARFIILAALIIPAIDWGLDVVGFWHNTPLSRIATGGLFGLMAGYFLARAFVHSFGIPRQGTEGRIAPPQPSADVEQIRG